ncbi:hypothetical protein AMK22_31465 [Streptomyces sp. CB01580]|nr:hypothetical protein AMK22_31465 [Streptomyces sp. CB01580]
MRRTSSASSGSATLFTIRETMRPSIQVLGRFGSTESDVAGRSLGGATVAGAEAVPIPPVPRAARVASRFSHRD